jgi:hypothetical protein
VKLDDPESLNLRCRANRSVGRRGGGGRLSLTDRRLVFEPRGAGLFDRSLRQRLRVPQVDDSEELFVVTHPDDLVAEITAALTTQL